MSAVACVTTQLREKLAWSDWLFAFVSRVTHISQYFNAIEMFVFTLLSLHVLLAD